MKLDDRIAELIAIGASVAANCQPCLQYHTQKAQEYGSCEQEISEAVAVGKLVRRGAASKMDTFVESLKEGTLAANAADVGCGCTGG